MRQPGRVLPLRIAAVLIMPLLFPGCASTTQTGPAPAVIGNEFGGKIPNGVNNTQASMNAAVAHCAKFGKKAQIIQMEPPSEGGLMGFDCRGRLP